MVIKTAMRLGKSILLLVAMTVMLCSAVYAESKVDKYASELIVHTDTTVVKTVNQILNNCDAESADWYERYLCTVALEYGRELGFVVFLGGETKLDVSSVVNYEEICGLLNDDSASVGKLFFAGHAAGDYGDLETAKTLLWKAFRKADNNQLKMRILDEIASYTVFKESYSYWDDGMIYGLHNETQFGLINDQNFEECVAILSEYNTIIDKYSWLKHCQISPVSSTKRMNYCELSFQVEYYLCIAGIDDTVYEMCEKFATNFPKLTIDENDKMMYRVYMYGFQSYALKDANKNNSKKNYSYYKNELKYTFLFGNVNKNIEMLDTLLEMR